MLTAIKGAFAMFSALPMPMQAWDKPSLRHLICALPLVGLVIGGAEMAWLWLALRFDLPELWRAAFMVLIPMAVSGGIHLDGFCDTVDALASRAEREKKQKILKDPHLGAFGAMYLSAYLLLYFALAAALPLQPRYMLLFALSFFLSRAWGGWAILLLPPFKQEGLGHTFAAATAKRSGSVLLAAEILLALAAALLLWPLAGLCMLLVCAGAFGFLRVMAMKQFGGMSGDLAGWLISLCELLLLLLLAVLAYFV